MQGHASTQLHRLPTNTWSVLSDTDPPACCIIHECVTQTGNLNYSKVVIRPVEGPLRKWKTHVKQTASQREEGSNQLLRGLTAAKQKNCGINDNHFQPMYDISISYFTKNICLELCFKYLNVILQCFIDSQFRFFQCIFKVIL